MTNKIKDLLLYIGTIGAIIVGFVYVIIIVVLVLGFEKSMRIDQLILISVLGAITGIMITNLLRTQGIALAKKDPNNTLVMKEYYATLNKSKKAKKLRTINFFMVKNMIIDIFSKALTIGISSYFVMYIFIEGSGDFALIGLALANILMFTCLGLMALAKTYDFYNEQHIPVIQEITKRLKESRNGSSENITTTSSEE